MIFFSQGSPRGRISPAQAREALVSCLDKLGPKKRVLALPPDFTRVHSQAGLLTEAAWEHYGRRLSDILPALGTHAPMTGEEIRRMFGEVPPGLFRVHDWRRGLASIGEVPAGLVREFSGGRIDYPIPIQVARLVAEGRHDLILSVGQVVPHEVAGMAGHNKNLFIGAGGAETIHRTHFLGAACGMEAVMGRADSPVRRVLDHASDNFARGWPVVHVLTVVGRADDGGLVLRGLFIGDDGECFARAAALARRVNVALLDEPLRKVVVYLDPAEYKSTWLGNKSVYRTRLAMADGGELVVLAPGVGRFGEDPVIDGLVRKYGYLGTAAVLDLVGREEDLRRNLSAAAHLIHGSSEGRFAITYCPGGLSRAEVEGVGFRYVSPDRAMKRYDPGSLREGYNTLPDGERVFFISDPGLGLWACREEFGGE
jgi:nickel-dependent lactate racemase